MDEYSLLDLCVAADVTPRTVRYYISSGLLPPSGIQGPHATYPAATLRRLKLIKALQRQHLPLAEIRARLDALDPAEVDHLLAPPGTSSAADYIARVLGQEAPRKPSAAPAAGPPRAGAPLAATPAQAVGARSTWERVTLHPDVEVHVRRPLDAETRRKLERLLDHARTLFTEPP